MITTSAPGSLMISGEHAVLHGAHAVVGAVNTRLTVTLTSRHDRSIQIQSALGSRRMTLDALDASAPFTFVTQAIRQYTNDCPSGFNLAITADMRADTGLGSSAAVTVALLTALHQFCYDSAPSSPERLHQVALDLVRQTQGTASGSDLAAAIWGGVLRYRQTPAVLARHTAFPPITVAYAGYKTPTADAIRQVEAKRKHSPDGFRQLFVQMDACSLAVDQAFANADWPALATALNHGQTLMETLGVCDPTLADLVSKLHQTPGITAAKISGSGLGDCVLAIGTIKRHSFPYRLIPVQFSHQGVMLESRCLFA